MTGQPKRRPTFIAAGLLCLSLGLPWGTASSLRLGPGWFTPSFCTTNFADGTMDCTPAYYSPGMRLDVFEVAGAASPARLFLVGALLPVLPWLGSASGTGCSP